MEVLGAIFGIAWYAVGLWGLIIARQKGHLQWFGGLGIVAFLLYGWVIALIVLREPSAGIRRSPRSSSAELDLL